MGKIYRDVNGVPARVTTNNKEHNKIYEFILAELSTVAVRQE